MRIGEYGEGTARKSVKRKDTWNGSGGERRLSRYLPETESSSPMSRLHGLNHEQPCAWTTSAVSRGRASMHHSRSRDMQRMPGTF